MQEVQEKVPHLTPNDLKLFEKAFYEVANSATNDISFRNFRDIVNLYKKFSRSIVSTCLEKIMKRMTSQNEDDIFISNKTNINFNFFKILKKFKILMIIVNTSNT
jgi:hypothetical protein